MAPVLSDGEAVAGDSAPGGIRFDRHCMRSAPVNRGWSRDLILEKPEIDRRTTRSQEGRTVPRRNDDLHRLSVLNRGVVAIFDLEIGNHGCNERVG